MPADRWAAAVASDELRAGVLMRAVFVIYLVLIAAGIAYSLVLGFLGV
jgi:hypothetical protein